MPTRLERWMRSKLTAMTARTPSSLVPLAAQSREEPVPYSLPASATRGRPLPVAHRRRVNRHLLVGRLVHGPAAFGARRKLVAQADVGKGAAHHHFVVAATGAVGIEILWPDAIVDQVPARRRVGLDGAGGGDVVGGDAVAQLDQYSCAPHRLNPARRCGSCPRNKAGSVRRWSRRAIHSGCSPGRRCRSSWRLRQRPGGRSCGTWQN